MIIKVTIRTLGTILLWYCCGKGNEEELECLQKRAARIVLKTVHLSTQDMVSGLGWDPLKTR